MGSLSCVVCMGPLARVLIKGRQEGHNHRRHDDGSQGPESEQREI